MGCPCGSSLHYNAEHVTTVTATALLWRNPHALGINVLAEDALPALGPAALPLGHVPSELSSKAAYSNTCAVAAVHLKTPSPPDSGRSASLRSPKDFEPWSRTLHSSPKCARVTFLEPFLRVRCPCMECPQDGPA